MGCSAGSQASAEVAKALELEWQQSQLDGLKPWLGVHDLRGAMQVQQPLLKWLQPRWTCVPSRLQCWSRQAWGVSRLGLAQQQVLLKWPKSANRWHTALQARDGL